MSSEKIQAVTTFHADGYDQYGKRFLESFDAHWPAGVMLHIYCEDIAPAEQSARFVYHDLADDAELAAFKQRHAATPKHRGILEDGDYGYRWDAVRFAHKVFALTGCALGPAGTEGRLFWIDADTVTHSAVPDFLFAAILPDHVYTSYLGRPHAYPECGFVGYRLDHPAHAEFMTFWRGLYLNDTLFELPEWHDSYVYDLVRRTFEEKGKFSSLDIAVTAPPSDHPFVNSILGQYMDHLKGSERKEAGGSFAEDYVGKAE